MVGHLKKYTSAAPLAVFRIALGLMLFLGIIRFWTKGWIDTLYIQPKYYFPFYGFEFVTAPGHWIYLVFAICGLSALFVALGFFYRFSIISLFLSFTYIELIDKSTYLNHYYFISLICLLMIFLPAHVYFSVDSYRNRNLFSHQVPQWCLDTVKLFVCILYFYAGLAKLNSDWLFNALPLKIWLPARNDMPLIGFLFNYTWVAFFFSWFGCIYDLTIPFILWNRKTRLFGYFTVIAFHLLTSLLFPIGMFPYIMIVTALIFFSAEFHQKIISFLARILKISQDYLSNQNKYVFPTPLEKGIQMFLVVFFTLQILMPFRYLLYPGELFWTEEGYRFSWRVMLMEKAGYAQFTVKDATGKHKVVNNNEFLTPLQEKMMSTQPDMILQYAHLLRDVYSKKGFRSPQVYVDSYVTLNGRLGKTFIDPSTDLAREQESFKHKKWILPFNDEIKGL